MPTFPRRCQSCVGSSLHSVFTSSSYRFGGSSIVYALASFWLDFNSGDRLFASLARGYGKLVSSFPGVVCRVCPLPAIFCFLSFSASVAFWFRGVNCVRDSFLRFNFVVPVFPQFAALRFVMAIFATVEAISSLIWFLFGWGLLSNTGSDAVSVKGHRGQEGRLA